MSAQKPTETMPLDDLKRALREFFTKSKANGSAADFLGQCSKDEMPEFLVSIVKSIQVIIERDLKGKTFVDVDGEDVDESSEHIETE
jgi:putative ATP-dependent endonuclease of OLD family